MNVKLQANQGLSRSVKALSLKNMLLFDYAPLNKRKHWKERVAGRQRHLITCVENILVRDNEGL